MNDENYKNILANSYMRDTNYIMIKDTDDIDELETQWSKFQSYMTPRQQRLSDDRSIEIWNITNQQHYDEIKQRLLNKFKEKDLKDKEITPDNPDVNIFTSGDFNQYNDKLPPELIPTFYNKLKTKLNKENLENYNEEKIETFLSTNPFEKNIKLYHGSPDPNLKKISPISNNNETRFSSMRKSSFWTANLEYAIFIGFMRNIQNLNIGHYEHMMDNCVTIITNNNDITIDEIKNRICDNYIYVYEKSIPKKYIGRGHCARQNEYSIDVDVIPDNLLKYKVSEVFEKFTISILKEDSPDAKNYMHKNKKFWNDRGSLINHIIYRDRDSYLKDKKKYKYDLKNKETSSLFNEDNNINLTIPDDIKDDPHDNADQFNNDSTMRIIGTINGETNEDKLRNLEKEFIDFNSQSNDIKRKADDKCRELFGGQSNLDRYNKLKSEYLSQKNTMDSDAKFIPATRRDEVDVDTIKTAEKVSKACQDLQEVTTNLHNDSFLAHCYSDYILKSINESENHQKVKRLEDVPYFTPQELIDLGVHGNNNYYSKKADNDGLSKDISITTWFDSYKDLSMNHIFEDYRKEWINKLNELYSDYYDIVDEDKLLSRKQSILDLGWNPEIPFTSENRKKASDRVNTIFQQTIPDDIFIDFESIKDPGEEYLSEMASSGNYEPVILVLTKGKTPVISQGIKFVTKSEYSHASITFDPELKEVYSFNMRKNNWGFIKENISSFKDNVISVFAFFANSDIVSKLKKTVYDFANHETNFDLRIFANKIFHINHKASNNEYNQVCSTFVDTVLKSGGINLVGNQKIPAPSDIYNGAKSIPNKIFEVYNGIAPKYNGKQVKRKIQYLQNEPDTLSINENNKYDPPMNLNDIKSNYGDELYRASTGIELIHKEPTKKELVRIMNNWDLMTDEQKEKSDKKSIELFGITNKENYNKLISSYNELKSVQDDNPFFIQDEFKLKKEKIKIGNTPANYYVWTDSKNNKVAEFYTYKHWDGINVVNLEIFRKYRGKGLSYKLLDYAINKCGVKCLSVEKSNSNAKHVYDKYGFKVVDQDDKYYYMSIKGKSTNESFSYFNETKKFPVEFDNDGNLTIYKCRMGNISYGDEIDDSSELLTSYRNTSNIEGMKYEVSRMWFFISSIEKNMTKRNIDSKKYEEYVRNRATAMNIFKTNIEYLMKLDKDFNFAEYYNTTPFSDNSVKITNSTLKYSMKALKTFLLK